MINTTTKELKPQIETGPKVVNDDAEPVTLTKGQLKGILSELDSLKNRGMIQKPKRVTEHYARLRYHEGKPVVWYGNVREKKDHDSGKFVTWMDIKLFEDPKAIPVLYLDFLNSRNDYANNAVQVAIKKQEVEEKIESLGRRQAENPNPATDPSTGRPLDSNWRPFEVEMEVTSREYTATIEVLEGSDRGKTFVLPSSCLNA